VEEHVADVVIVGAGPAGCSAGVDLARSGVDVLMLDRSHFPREKVCGDGLAPRSIPVLRELGVEREIQALGYRPFREYRVISSWGDSVRAGIPSSLGKGADHAYVVPRVVLDEILVRRVREEGGRLIEGARAVGAVAEEDGTLAVTALAGDGTPSRYRARVVIAADGSRGSFSRTVVPARHLRPGAVAMRAYLEGVDVPEALTFVLDRALLPGYGWIFPGGRPGEPANVGVGTTVGALGGRGSGLRRLFDYFVNGQSAARPLLRSARVVSTPSAFPLLMDFPGGRRVGGPILLAGDAANLVDPLSGEGIAYALESGRSAAVAIERALSSGDMGSLAGYERELRRGLGVEFLGAYMLRLVLSRSWGNGSLIRLLGRDEGWARGGIGVLSNSIPVTWLAKPGVLSRALAPGRLGRAIRAARPASK
jgi:geranylgeranyl reductase family protein